MTTSLATSRKESLPIGTPSSPTASPGAVVYQEFHVARPLPLPNTVSLASLINEFESEPGGAAGMAQARQNLAANLYADEPETLSSLRLRAGLSQAQLAMRAETTQPYIAKLEAGRADPGTHMIARIAQALGVEEALAYRAIRNQLASRGE